MEYQMELGIQMGHHNQSITHFEYLIVGGGVAGLSVANRLVDHGVAPAIVDAGKYPMNKVCGEFFTSECHQILKKWDIAPPSVIRSVRFHTLDGESYVFPLPSEAWGISRYKLDAQLYERSINNGAHGFLETAVQKINYVPEEEYKYNLLLDRGINLYAKKLFVGTGRIASLLFCNQTPKFEYMGFKQHFQARSTQHTLEMISIPHGYLGVSPVENGKVNVACLVKKEAINKDGSPSCYFNKVLQTPSGKIIRSILKCDDNLFQKSMQVEVPEFSIKMDQCSNFKNLFLIGDAAATIAPVSGAGLGIGITSAVMAADYAVNDQEEHYVKRWSQTYCRPLRWASGIHWLMLNPFFGQNILYICSKCPQIFRFLYSKTRP